jgi:hypothetical protein
MGEFLEPVIETSGRHGGQKQAVRIRSQASITVDVTPILRNQLHSLQFLVKFEPQPPWSGKQLKVREETRLILKSLVRISM